MAWWAIGFISISSICHVRMLVGVGRLLVDKRSNKKKFQQQIVKECRKILGGCFLSGMVGGYKKQQRRNKE